jgi:hypothetical protein
MMIVAVFNIYDVHLSYSHLQIFFYNKTPVSFLQMEKWNAHQRS